MGLLYLDYYASIEKNEVVLCVQRKEKKRYRTVCTASPFVSFIGIDDR